MNNIFNESIDLKIDFGRYDQDLLERGRDRLLYQFKSSVVVDQLVQVISQENQELYDSIIGILRGRTLAEATGVQLDMLGELVGQDRINIDGSLNRWFTPDDDNLIVDDSDIWVQGAHLYEDTVASDIEFRKLIFSKIFKNHVQGASVPELRYFIKILTNQNVSFKTTGPLEASLVVLDTILTNTLSLLKTIWENDKRTDNKYLLPSAATTRISGVVFLPQGSYINGSSGFAPDTEFGTDGMNSSSFAIYVN